MSKRYFTADFHFGMPEILQYETRPFSNIQLMNDGIVDMCCKMTTGDDVIVHIGDLACYNANNGKDGLKVNPLQFLKQIPATFINIRGNHDLTNRVKSLCSSMRTNLGKYKDVSLSHFPSYDSRSIGSWAVGDIHLCGHVHSKWKHCLDVKNKVLNINVGLDAWNYALVPEDKLISYIDSILKLSSADINLMK